MTTLKYTGTAHFRELKKSDFNHHEGVEGEAIKIARHDIFPEQNSKNYPTTVEVSQETADWLVENEAGDWAVVEAKEAEKLQDNQDENSDAGGELSTAPNASDAPSGAPDPASRTSQASKKASSTPPR